MLYLDEPTTGLDPHSRSEVWGMLRGLVADGTTVLLTTQYLEEADHPRTTSRSSTRPVPKGEPHEVKTSSVRQVLELSPGSRSDLAAVAELLELVTGAAPAIGVESGQVSVQVEGGRSLPGIMRAIDDRSIELAEFALRRASLDEVFLILTGHRAEEPAEAAQPDARESGKAAAAAPARERREQPMTTAANALPVPLRGAEPGDRGGELTDAAWRSVSR